MDKFNIKEVLPWDAISPLLFLACAGALCFLLPVDARSKVLPIVIGAALTRVRAGRPNGKK